MAKVIDGRSNVARAIKSDIYSQIREALTKPEGRSKKSFSQEFIQLMLKEAKSNPSGAIGQLLAKQLMSDDIISKLDAETDKYLARDLDFAKFRILNTLYKEQRDVFLDNYKRKAVVCSRRVGKTELAARLLLLDSLYTGHHAIFISLKFENGIRQCYPITLELAKSLNLPIIRESKSDGEIQFANGSNILFKGNNNKMEADKLLGYKFSCCIIDEVQNQTNLQYLLDTVLSPAMTDYEDSRLVVLGTPPRIPKTYLEQIWTEQRGWQKYTWNMLANPYLNNVEEYINSIAENKGVTVEAPFIQREMFGVWTYDTEAQVYKDAQLYESIPADFVPTDCAIGVDFGFSDFNSLVSIIYNRHTTQGYAIETRKFNKSNVTAIVETAKQIYDISLQECLKRNKDFELNKIWLYSDTSDQSISLEMSTKYKLPITNAMKYDKRLGIEQLSDLLRTGKIKISKTDNILIDEMSRTVYKRDESDNILPEIDDTVFHPDALDALLYASRQFVYDCNLSDDIKKPTTMSPRSATLPQFLQEEANDSDEQ